MKEDNYAISIQKLAYFLIVICLLFYIAYIGKNILVPLAFGAVFAFLLKPICERVEKIITIQSIAVGVTFIITLLPVIGILAFFSIQFIDVFNELPSLTGKIQGVIDNAFLKINSTFGFTKSEAKEIIDENSAGIIQAPFSYLGTTLNFSSNFLINLLLTIIYTFLFLLYRRSLKQFYLIQFGDRIKEGAETVLRRAQIVIQKYLYGLLLVILVLGVLNSIGLAVIGIKYALFWGFLAAFLAVIPYIGTALGGLIPFLYALATAGNYWQPAAVILLFTIVQTLEGNLITPKIVGSSVKINPLAAILTLLVGGSIWGVSGLILSLPFIAIVRVVFLQIDFLKPIGLLMSDELYEKEDVFEEKFDKERYRIFSFFKKKKPL